MKIFRIPSGCQETCLHEVVWQQKIGNSLLDGVFMPAVPTHQLALTDLRLQQ